MRMLVDLADADGGRWVNQSGASGHPFGPYYADQAELWATNRTWPMVTTRNAVAAQTRHTLVLTPTDKGAEKARATGRRVARMDHQGVDRPSPASLRKNGSCASGASVEPDGLGPTQPGRAGGRAGGPSSGVVPRWVLDEALSSRGQCTKRFTRDTPMYPKQTTGSPDGSGVPASPDFPRIEEGVLAFWKG